jgi:hypothetical protein
MLGLFSVSYIRSKISFIINFSLQNNMQLLDEAEQNIVIYHSVARRSEAPKLYFATAEFNNCFIIQFIIYDLLSLASA